MDTTPLRKAYPALKIVLLSANAQDETAAHQAEAALVGKGTAPEDFLATLTHFFTEHDPDKE